MYIDDFIKFLIRPFNEVLDASSNAGHILSEYMHEIATHGNGDQEFDRHGEMGNSWHYMAEAVNNIGTHIERANIGRFYQELDKMWYHVDKMIRNIFVQTQILEDFYRLNPSFDKGSSLFVSKNETGYEPIKFSIMWDTLMMRIGQIERGGHMIADVYNTKSWFNSKDNPISRIEKVHGPGLDNIGVNKLGLQSISQLENFSWQAFEDLSALYFADLGYEVFKTMDVKDGGFDLLLLRKMDDIKNGKPDRLLVQCKKYNSERRVGVEIVRELFAVSQIQPSMGSICITSTNFTKGAKDLSRISNGRIQLVSVEEIRRWIEE